MSYTNNIPQGNQQIAATQPLIQSNFGFIQTDLDVEHIFNGNTGPLGATQAEGTHIQASMPNQNDPVALPTGCNGMYYVGNGGSRFFDGTFVSRLTEASIGTNGYQWVGRLLIQWGNTLLSASSPQLFSSPNINFPNACFGVFPVTYYNLTSIPGSSSTSTVYILSSSGSPSTTGFGWKYGGSSSGVGFYWIAIGY